MSNFVLYDTQVKHRHTGWYFVGTREISGY